MIYFNMLMISFIIVYIINFSGIIVDLSKLIWKLFNKGEYQYQIIMKPFSCALCMNFWLITIYALSVNMTFIISLALGCLFASVISLLIDKMLTHIIKIIHKL